MIYMKEMLKRIWDEITRHFKNLRKYYRVEDEARIELEKSFNEYRMNSSMGLLQKLVDLVNFMNRIGINGKTEFIKETILKEWEKVITIKDYNEGV